MPGNNTNIVVVQPNIDPYEKVSITGSFEAQLQKLIATSEKEMDDNTALVIWPETALYMDNRESMKPSMKENFFLNPLMGFSETSSQYFIYSPA